MVAPRNESFAARLRGCPARPWLSRACSADGCGDRDLHVKVEVVLIHEVAWRAHLGAPDQTLAVDPELEPDGPTIELLEESHDLGPNPIDLVAADEPGSLAGFLLPKK